MTIMHNSFDRFYRKPFGAVKSNTKIKIRLKMDKSIQVQWPEILVCELNQWFNTTAFPMKLEDSNDKENIFCGDIILKQPKVYYYCFRALINGREKIIKRLGIQNQGIITDGSEGVHWQITIFDEFATTPEDFKGGIMYQIFPDRFYNSGIAKYNVPKDRNIHKKWNEFPEYESNSGVLDYYAGDIQGIISKLPYIKRLGVEELYLNPIVEAHSNHRYNTANYLAVDPMLGTWRDVEELCNNAHDIGIKIILDGVFNHTGSDSIYFNRNKRYKGLDPGAFNSKESKYYKWYTFTSFPREYNSWWGFDTLPVIKHGTEEFSNFVESVLDFWFSKGIDGVRLDVADELTDEFIQKLRSFVKKHGKDKILIGEVWEDASIKCGYGKQRKYLLGKELDSVMNYPFKDAILSYVRYGDTRIYHTIMSILENYPKCVIDVLMNSLSTHDTVRALTQLVADEVGCNDRKWQAENDYLDSNSYELGKKMFKIASIIQYFLPGIPCLYYGDEVGVYGYKDPFNRKPYPWEKQDIDLLSFFMKLGKVRIENKDILKDAEFRFIEVNQKVLIFERLKENNKLLIAVNRTNVTQAIKINPNEYNRKVIFRLGQSHIDKLSPYGGIIVK